MGLCSTPVLLDRACLQALALLYPNAGLPLLESAQQLMRLSNTKQSRKPCNAIETMP